MLAPVLALKNEDVLAVIRRYPNGVTLDQIEKELSPAPQRRMLQYSLGVLAESGQIVKGGTARAPLYRCANMQGEDARQAQAPRSAPLTTNHPGNVPVSGTLAAPTTPAPAPARQPMAPQPAAPAPSPVVEQRLGATAIGVDPELVNNLVDLVAGSRMPPAALKMYIRQAAYGLPNPNEFIAAVEAELARR